MGNPASKTRGLRRAVITLVAAAGLAVGMTPAASADPDDSVPALLSRQATSAAELKAQIDLQLELYPGGKQTAPNEVSYDGGRFVVTYAKPGVIQPLAADCPSGWFCFYDYTNYGYPRGRLSDVGWQDLATYGWHDRTESVHNNTSTAVDFDNHTSGGHVNDVFLFCVTGRGAISDVSPNRNRADHVFRWSSGAFC